MLLALTGLLVKTVTLPNAGAKFVPASVQPLVIISNSLPPLIKTYQLIPQDTNVSAWPIWTSTDMIHWDYLYIATFTNPFVLITNDGSPCKYYWIKTMYADGYIE